MSIIHYQMEIKMIYNERKTEHFIVLGGFLTRLAFHNIITSVTINGKTFNGVNISVGVRVLY